ncbi:MAG: zinc ribbon domain-containing protein [Candidatus Bathyarchaeota archaeon]|nr:zinc ribbon domain-containing protein [Candidatus Bathyarchaeota archaeon]MCX8176994.1 zinc ribbon domain-containing protein [Candidatus Bathyarchaeota archaeon]MDW8194392.1 zinc ribbon domain-containing protein [Nitrososphaerota archaeon]
MGKVLVYCVKCGAKNPDDAKTCSQCGAPLYTLEYKHGKHKDECFGDEETECFGIPRGGAVLGLAVGIIIIIAGLSMLLKELFGISMPWWPFVIIIFGVIITIGAVYGLARKH